VQAGGSTQLATQIVEGAPADVFAAASESAMDIVTQTPNAVFATNDLVLATPAGNPGEVEGLEDLARGELVVAVCDPAVPCGELTQAVLEDQGLEIAPDTEEPNVRAVLNKIVLDEVDAGPVYRSDAVAAGDSVNTIPIDSDRVNHYPITALSDSETARRFIDMVLSEPARATLEEAGFGAP
jgi:molybdate transport system substrate-binding protein